MKAVLRLVDSVLGRWLRHMFFVLVRPYYSLFYNVSCSNKHLLQDLPGGLILATHVSRHDGPMIAALLYSTMRVRPAVHYDEYHNWFQWFPMMVAGAIPLSSPKTWSPERRAARKDWALGVMRKVIKRGHLVLLFPSGRVRRQPGEMILPYLSGAYDTLQAIPDCPVALIRIEGLSKFEEPIYDRFWTFLGIGKGRRHVNVRIELLEGFRAEGTVEEFNARLEALMNADTTWPLRPEHREHVVQK